ncbi:MAG TPA: hypothetical protein EYG92_05675 [Lutibacter sp.]|nr:hypothetical protein [Lutibacter sp.]
MLFQPTYFSPIIQFEKVVQVEKCIFEIHDNYQKQTYRTRLSIYTPQGRQDLIIPIKHKKGIKLMTKEIEIDNSYKWQRLHFKSLQNFYRSSPFFEFYEDDLAPLYEKQEKYLLDLLLKTQELSFEMLQLEFEIKKTTKYLVDYPINQDFRFLDNPKLSIDQTFRKYIQVFDAKHGFIPNLSILDLIFNEGPNAVNILSLR